MIKRKVDSSVDNTLNARILYYDFFAGLFLYDLLINRENLLKDQINILRQYPLSDDNLESFDFLYVELCENGIKNFVFEHTYLFMLPFASKTKTSSTSDKKSRSNHSSEINSKTIILYLSYYIDESIAGKGLTLAKQLVKQSKIRINDVNCKENEEHFGFLMLFMKHLLQNNDIDLSMKVFKECIKPMQYKIITGLHSVGDDCLYYHVSKLLSEFMGVELGLLS